MHEVNHDPDGSESNTACGAHFSTPTPPGSFFDPYGSNELVGTLLIYIVKRLIPATLLTDSWAGAGYLTVLSLQEDKTLEEVARKNDSITLSWNRSSRIHDGRDTESINRTAHHP